MNRILLASIIVVMTVSCSTKKDDETTSSVECTATNPDHWGTGVSAIVQNNCVGCHSTYSTYAGASAAAAGIALQVNSGAMPQGASLSAADKSSLVQWAACGSPQ